MRLSCILHAGYEFGSFRVHLEWPSGAGPQAICISVASVRSIPNL